MSNDKPFPPGTLVMPYVGGLIYEWGCKGHVYITGKAQKDASCGSGFSQTATCLVCENSTDEIGVDSHWWRQKPTKKEIRAARKILREKIKLLERSVRLLDGAKR